MVDPYPRIERVDTDTGILSIEDKAANSGDEGRRRVYGALVLRGGTLGSVLDLQLCGLFRFPQALRRAAVEGDWIRCRAQEGRELMLLGLDKETLALSTEQQQLLRRIDFEGWLSGQSNPVAQRLTARSDTPWTEQDIRALERDVLSAFSAATAPVGPPPDADPIGVGDPHSEVSGPACAVQIGQILGKIIAATNKVLEAPLPSVGSVSRPRYPVNPFRRDVVTALGRVKCWRKLIPSAITKMGPEESPSRGLVLLSAALYGGIFDTDLLVAVARALGTAPVTLGLANQHLYLQISVAWRGMQDFTRRTCIRIH